MMAPATWKPGKWALSITQSPERAGPSGKQRSFVQAPHHQSGWRERKGQFDQLPRAEGTFTGLGRDDYSSMYLMGSSAWPLTLTM